MKYLSLLLPCFLIAAAFEDLPPQSVRPLVLMVGIWGVVSITLSSIDELVLRMKEISEKLSKIRCLPTMW